VESAVAMNDLAVIVDLLGILTLKPYVVLSIRYKFQLTKCVFDFNGLFLFLFIERCGTWTCVIPYWVLSAISFRVNTRCKCEIFSVLHFLSNIF